MSSSVATTARLKSHGIPVLDLNDVDALPVYVDGADEIDGSGAMIKGGGGALTREKIVASVSDISSASPTPASWSTCSATSRCRSKCCRWRAPRSGAASRRWAACPCVRVTKDGVPFITDNGNEIIDVKGLPITDPRTLEAQINAWPGVVTVGPVRRPRRGRVPARHGYRRRDDRIQQGLTSTAPLARG